MKKIILPILVIFTFLFFTQEARAVTLEAQTDRTTNTQTFVVLADPPEESTAVKLRLNIQGGTVTSFSAGDDELLSIGTCDDIERKKYTDNSVCVDIATAAGSLKRADVLGVLTVEKQDGFVQLRIDKGEDNAYVGPGGVTKEDSGVAFILYGGDLINDTKRTTRSGSEFLLVLMVTFLMGVVIGTTFTTLGHVLQVGRMSSGRKQKV